MSDLSTSTPFPRGGPRSGTTEMREIKCPEVKQCGEKWQKIIMG